MQNILSVTFVFMLRHLTAIVFVLGFVFQTFNKPFIMLDYYANTSAYSKNCVNKTRPAMHCMGKCQMMKKIREEEKREAEKEALKFQYKVEVLSSKSFYSYSLVAPGGIFKRPVAYETRSFPVDRSLPVFHPPSV